MERAARFITRLKSKALEPGDLAVAAWPVAVGKRLAERTRAAGFVCNRLIVEVEDREWQRQLTAMRPHLLDHVRRIIGSGLVADIEFRIGVPRRPPQMAAASSADEADGIADPIFRRLYREGRERAAH